MFVSLFVKGDIMTKLDLLYFMDYEDGKMGRFETTGDEGGVPVNIFIDNYSDGLESFKGLCSMDICGLGYGIEFYKTEEGFEKAHSDFRMAVPSMIPMGTFSAWDGGTMEENPRILFTGRVLDVQRDPEASEEEPNVLIYIDTYGFEFFLYTRHDGEIEKGDIVHGIAWIYGDIVIEQ